MGETHRKPWPGTPGEEAVQPNRFAAIVPIPSQLASCALAALRISLPEVEAAYLRYYDASAARTAEAGIPDAEILRALTVNAAACFGRADDMGQVGFMR